MKPIPAWAWVSGTTVLVIALLICLSWCAWVFRGDFDDLAAAAQVCQLILLVPALAWAALQYHVSVEAQKRAAEDQRRSAEFQKEAADFQRKSKHFQAWQTISAAQGKSGSGGRKNAIEELHKDGISLVGVDLSGGAYLEELSLPGADLSGAHLEKAKLSGAHLEEADLSGAHLEEADLSVAHLKGAILWGTRLEEANLMGAHLESAILKDAHLGEANLWGAYLEKANLKGAHLEGAYFWTAHLEGANLKDAHLDGANLAGAHLEGAILSLDQILSAVDWRGATMPDSLRDLEIQLEAPEEEMDELGRTWRPDSGSSFDDD